MTTEMMGNLALAAAGLVALVQLIRASNDLCREGDPDGQDDEQ